MDINHLATKFFNNFNSTHVILYVGQGMDNDALKKYISSCRWSAVITSRTDSEFAAIFADESRSPREFYSRADIPMKLLHRERLPILRLLGVENGISGADEEDFSWLGETDDLADAKKMLELVPELMDHVNPLVVTGIASEVDHKLMRTLVRVLYSSASDGAVSFWGMHDEDKSYAAIQHKLTEEKKFGWYTTELEQIIRARMEESADSEQDFPLEPDDGNDIFFRGEAPVSISQRDLLFFKNIGTLLTERTINHIRPLGREQSRKWFSNFLEMSATNGPQWYGYLPKSTFYVKRSYEDALVQMVRRMLAGKGADDTAKNHCPIILAGDPGSSKSISLGALAYRIYNERINPVIYISNDSFFAEAADLDQLDCAMQLLGADNSKPRVLIIWDSSTYRSGVERIKKLFRELNNRGRRFVLVCSGYSMPGKGEDQNDRFYCLPEKSTKLETCSREEDAQVIYRGGCYYVRATREVTERERAAFWRIIREYSGINEKTISAMRAKIGEDAGIFDYYYKLISLMRETLEKGLNAERRTVNQYVKKELGRALGEEVKKREEEKQRSPVYLAFLNAGLDPAAFLPEEENAGESCDDLDAKLDRLNLCVALFSRFKLEVPYGLAYTILLNDDGPAQYSVSSQELFKIVTTDIPWLYYGETKNGDFAFRFRNALEADIYLREHDISGTKQIELLCQIIDIYGMDYRRSRCLDLNFTSNLQALLRMMGPNSKYIRFQQPQGQIEYKNILTQQDEIIEKILELEPEYGVPDEDAGFANIAITFIREFYSNLWDKWYGTRECAPWEHDPAHFSEQTYQLRIQKLTDALALAEKSIESLEDKINGDSSYWDKNHMISQHNSIIVEMAQCNIKLLDLCGEYERFCDQNDLVPTSTSREYAIKYPALYKRLWEVIVRDPTNGYAYNTIFKAFERMYETANLSPKIKLQYLSEIMQVVESCTVLGAEITNRGSGAYDELSAHILTITDYCAGVHITTEDIIRHRRGEPAKTNEEAAFFQLYDEMLEAQNAAAITFVCQKELRVPKANARLNANEKMRCRNVYQFMREADHFACVCSNSFALALLIRVTWMLCNDTVLSNTPECQLTRLSESKWKEIYQLCSMYSGLSRENRQPLIVLLYALATIHLGGLHEESFTEALEILHEIHEGAFYQPRMRTPFMLCQENGEPYRFSGTVLGTKGNGGYIQVNGVPRRLNGDTGVRFHHYNLGRNTRMPQSREVLRDLELGIGYTGLSVYKQAGREEKEERI